MLGQVMSGVGGTDVPTNITALGLLAVVVFFFLRRTDKDDKRRDDEAALQHDELAAARAENTTLNVKIDALQQEILEQRKAKHDAINNETKQKARLAIIRKLSRDCTCGALDRMEMLWED